MKFLKKIKDFFIPTNNIKKSWELQDYIYELECELNEIEIINYLYDDTRVELICKISELKQKLEKIKRQITYDQGI